jgi:hypothetical protein
MWRLQRFIDGEPQLSCITLCVRVTLPATTVEGLSGKSADIAKAFAEYGGCQCGFCKQPELLMLPPVCEIACPYLLRKRTSPYLRWNISSAPPQSSRPFWATIAFATWQSTGDAHSGLCDLRYQREGGASFLIVAR